MNPMQKGYTPSQLAEATGVSKFTIRRLIDSGKLKAANFSTHPRRKKWIVLWDDYLEFHRQNANLQPPARTNSTRQKKNPEWKVESDFNPLNL